MADLADLAEQCSSSAGTMRPQEPFEGMSPEWQQAIYFNRPVARAQSSTGEWSIPAPVACQVLDRCRTVQQKTSGSSVDIAMTRPADQDIYPVQLIDGQEVQHVRAAVYDRMTTAVELRTKAHTCGIRAKVKKVPSTSPKGTRSVLSTIPQAPKVDLLAENRGRR